MWADLYVKWAHSLETAFQKLWIFSKLIPTLVFQISSSQQEQANTANPCGAGKRDLTSERNAI